MNAMRFKNGSPWTAGLGGLAGIGAPSAALAHGGPTDAAGLWSAWTFDPVVVVPFLLAVWLYGRGLAALWRRAGIDRGVRLWQAACFAAGMAALFLALIWPLDRLSDGLLAAHMLQHMLLMAVAPPLVVLGWPQRAMLWAVPMSWRRGLGAMTQNRAWRSAWAAVTGLSIATLLQTVVLWGWHAPAVFDWANRNDVVHAIEHASFLGAALLFWSAVLRAGRADGLGPAAGALGLLTTLMHSGLLGALLTLAPVPLYDSQIHGPEHWDLSPLEDQQLAGLIMWVPAGTLYLLAGVGLVAVWLRALERRGPLDWRPPG